MSESIVKPRLLGGAPTIIMNQNETKEKPQQKHLGRVGLLNYANNCYLNVVVQILANIHEVKQLFLGNSYSHQINKANSLGSGGKITNAFADTINALWDENKKLSSYNPGSLKAAVSSVFSSFSGFQQCDAQEFLAALLDGLHEDMNHSLKYEYVDKNASKQPSQASEWYRYLHRNNSPIAKQFHGQLMSVVTCNSCNEVSKTFDPFAQISLPISSSTLKVSVVLYTPDGNLEPTHLIVKVPKKDASVGTLKACMENTSPSIKAKHILILNASRHSYGMGFAKDESSVKSLLQQKYIVAYQIPSDAELNNSVFIPCYQQLSSWIDVILSRCCCCGKASDGIGQMKRCTGCFGVAYCSIECQKKHWKDHKVNCVTYVKSEVGLPFVLDISNKSESRLSSWATFSKTVEESALFSVERREYINKEKSNHSQDFIIKSYKSSRFDNKYVILKKEDFSRELLTGCQWLCVEWRHQINATPMTKTKNVIGQNFMANEDTSHISIEDCFQVFKGPELLNEKDGWKCPKCKAVRAATKELFVTHLPRVLFLHLKRFSYSGFGQKVKDSVSYPLNNFDMSPFTSKEYNTNVDRLYDLVGVVSHLGSMQMGHYTCMTRLLDDHNKEIIGWRYFDDDYVDDMPDNKIVSPSAYLLVYRKRTESIPLIQTLSIRQEIVKETVFTNGTDEIDYNVHYPYRFPSTNKITLSSLSNVDNINMTEYDLD